MRKRQLMASLAGLAVAAGTLLSMGLTVGPASAAAASGCPSTRTGLATDNQVSASFSNTNNVTTTYTFSSLANENPSGGVPGLIKYCVYPSPSSFKPASITPQAVGDNGKTWTTGTGSNNFAFVRPSGDPSNIGLRNQDVTMGKATWSNLPASQSFVLHVNDPGVCASLYGAGSSGTCFVLPGPPRQVGPVCNLGETNAAYNANPFGVVNCHNPALGFEAQSVSEFGDDVGLAGPVPLKTLTVDFQSFACQSGHWYDGACTSAPGSTFSLPITANIYAVGNGTTPGPLLATETVTQTIPYRPTADPSCPANSGPAPAGAAYVNTQGVPGDQCQNSIGTLVSFSNWSFTGAYTGNLPGGVIWTVAFNTSDYGSTPQRPQACNSGADLNFPGLTNGGCPYDSLNVGDKSYPGAPYAGSDPTPDVTYINQGGTGLQSQSGWTGFRPLGEINAP